MNFNQLDGAHLLAARPRLAACTGSARPTRRGATTARLWPMPISFAGVVILEFIRKTKKVTAGIASRDVQRATCDMRPMSRVCWQQIKSHKRHQIMCGTWVLRLNGCPFPASLKGQQGVGAATQSGRQAGLFVNPSAPANKVFQFLSHNKRHQVFAPYLPQDAPALLPPLTSNCLLRQRLWRRGKMKL